MSAQSAKLIGWTRLIGFLGFLFGIAIVVIEATGGTVTLGSMLPAAILIIGGAAAFIWGAYLPKLLKQ